jgi:hypothetical protein
VAPSEEGGIVRGLLRVEHGIVRWIAAFTRALTYSRSSRPAGSTGRPDGSG